ncbi:MAG TPA: xanthine dehydrogenase family protein molybdopterin-binding subunit [Oligoflexus sp.]|uniref:xanthine dehydrogenase family protein molybdopterin-binding subunit n=1 Tax=Oligoflexus sp. TaxID=1971216 RepID=UPI002D71B0C2|nr:xanthine dehydrogenase family protein molybdopterin-binding subunit [Oligoflexus sp.]HYX36927.1 xanthine dehydrogenase family protein molybdopterin-binding subunit [Oligoflexus sp.]
MLDRFPDQPSRRDFLKTGAALTSGLVVAFSLPMGLGKFAWAQDAVTPNKDFTSAALPNAFIKISSDNSIRLIINKLEMGQGVNTSLAQLMAEELECDWQRITCESAPVAPVYNATFMPLQMAGGSSSVSSSWEQLRVAGAMAREMLIAAAAEKWGVPAKEIRAENGAVHHGKKGSLTYGELAEAAAKQKPPAPVKLKDPKHFKVIGQSMKRVDAADKTNGKAIFGLDVKAPDMLYAVIARPPFGGSVQGFDEAAARKVPGMKEIIKLDGNKVAFVGTNTWAAMKGRDAANVKWTLSDDPLLTQSSLQKTFLESLDKPGTLVKTVGNPGNALKKASRTLEATYEFPYLAHACMEPMNCTVAYDGKSAHIWAGHQMPTTDRMVAAKILGLPPESIEVTTTYAGGSFGRRANKDSDFVVEASSLAKQLKKPIKVVWTREDDTRGGYYRPMTMHKITAGLDSKGRMSGWDHRIVGQGVMAGSVFGAQVDKTGIDPTSIEGVENTHYALNDFQLQLQLMKSPVTTLWWRSVGHTHTAYVMETFIDELATAAKKDPLQYRKAMIPKSPRHQAVLDLLAQKSDWGKKMAEGRALGLAVHESFNSVVGHVVEVSVKGTDVKVHKIVSAVHCGTVVNPKGAQAQVESAIVYGLSACLYGELTLDKGQVKQGNFHDYPVLRMPDMPVIEVHFVPSTDTPTGLGEPGLPPLAPAIANAIFKLNGKRVRSQPFSKGLA